MSCFWWNEILLARNYVYYAHERKIKEWFQKILFPRLDYLKAAIDKHPELCNHYSVIIFHQDKATLAHASLAIQQTLELQFGWHILSHLLFIWSVTIKFINHHQHHHHHLFRSPQNSLNGKILIFWKPAENISRSFSLRKMERGLRAWNF